MILQYLDGGYPTDDLVAASARPLPADYLSGYVEEALSDDLMAHSAEAIISRLDGMRCITCHFPKLCLIFYNYDLPAIDNCLREYEDLYPRLRKLFLQSIENMAHFYAWPMKLCDRWFGSFLTGDGPDFGIPGLEITSFLFSHVSLDSTIDPERLGQWFVSELSDRPHHRQVAILRCFWQFLSSTPFTCPIESYREMFIRVITAVDAFISDGEERSEKVALSLHVLL
jgi:hypothetical protein